MTLIVGLILLAVYFMWVEARELIPQPFRLPVVAVALAALIVYAFAGPG